MKILRTPFLQHTSGRLLLKELSHLWRSITSTLGFSIQCIFEILQYYMWNQTTTTTTTTKESNTYVTTSKLLNSWKCHYNICIKFQLKNNHFFCVQEDIWTSTNLQLGRGRKVGRLLPMIFQNRHSIMLMKNTSYQYQHVNNKANSKNPTCISLFKFNNRSIRKRCEICWKLIRKTPVYISRLFKCLYCWLWTTEC